MLLELGLGGNALLDDFGSDVGFEHQLASQVVRLRTRQFLGYDGLEELLLHGTVVVLDVLANDEDSLADEVAVFLKLRPVNNRKKTVAAGSIRHKDKK